VGSRWRRSYGPDTSACFALATFSSSSPADLVQTKGLGLPFLTPLPISRGYQQSSNLRIRAGRSAWILNHPSGREHYESGARSRSRIDCNARSGRAAAAGGDASCRPVVRTRTRPADSSPTPPYLECRRGGTDPLARHRVDVERTPGAGTIAQGAILVAPTFLLVVAALTVLMRSRTIAAAIDAAPLWWLVAYQGYRLNGIIFLPLWADGFLPGFFALPAGIGDALTGGFAIAAAVALWRKSPWAQPLAYAVNIFGLADLVNAITMGLLSIATSGAISALLIYPLPMVPSLGFRSESSSTASLSGSCTGAPELLPRARRRPNMLSTALRDLMASDVGATLVVARCRRARCANRATTGVARTAGNAGGCRLRVPSNVITLVDASIPSDWLKRATSSVGLLLANL
jgi:hypothetical protein